MENSSDIITAFKSRSRDLFSCLDGIEESHKGRSLVYNNPDLCKPDPIEEPDFVCKAGFKRPRGAPRKSRIPDYKLRPEKWKMYNLSDVSLDQMSEQSNTKAAFDFMNSVQVKNGTEDDEAEEGEVMEVDRLRFVSSHQHIFRKPTKTSETNSKPQEEELKCTDERQVKVSDIKLNVLEAAEKEIIDADSPYDVGAEPAAELSTANDVHFQTLKSRNKSIRARTEDSDEEEAPAAALSIKETAEEMNSDSEDEFSDHQTLTEDEDIDALPEEASDDEDVRTRAAKFESVKAVHLNSSFVPKKKKVPTATLR